jgi:hypothetical protein
MDRVSIRPSFAVLAVVASGCFVEAVGGGDGSGGATGSATVGDVVGSTGLGTASGSTGASVTSASAGGAGGGAGGCANSFLSFDGDAEARIDQEDAVSINYANDFSFGARVRFSQTGKFADGSGAGASQILRRIDPTSPKGYALAIGERGVDGAIYADASAFPGNLFCQVLHTELLPFDQWVRLDVHFRHDGIAPDLRLTVDGVEQGATCAEDQDVPTFTGELTIGYSQLTAMRHFTGDLDDVYFKTGPAPPLTPQPPACAAEYAAIFTFEGGLASSCGDPLIPIEPGVGLAEPVIGCE